MILMFHQFLKSIPLVCIILFYFTLMQFWFNLSIKEDYVCLFICLVEKKNCGMLIMLFDTIGKLSINEQGCIEVVSSNVQTSSARVIEYLI